VCPAGSTHVNIQRSVRKNFKRQRLIFRINQIQGFRHGMRDALAANRNMLQQLVDINFIRQCGTDVIQLMQAGKQCSRAATVPALAPPQHCLLQFHVGGIT